MYSFLDKVKIFLWLIGTIFRLDLNIVTIKQKHCATECLCSCNQWWTRGSHFFEAGPVTSNLLLVRKLEWITLKSIFFLNAQLMKYITHSFQSGLMFQNIYNVNDHLHALVSFAPKHSGFCSTKMPNNADWHTTVLHRVKISMWTQPGKCETCSWSRHCQ